MARFLTTKQVEAEVENVLRNAEKHVAIVSPYIKFSRIILDRLIEMGNCGVSTTLVYGKKWMDSEEYHALDGIPGLTAYYLENLHSKAYANENVCIVTSMNCYEALQTANREMGVLLSRNNDPEAFKQAWEEINSITIASELRKVVEPIPGSASCIKCSVPMNFNLDAPLCDECYSTWIKFGDPNYIEKYCHFCGEASDVAKSRPLCDRCDRLLEA